MSCGRAIKYLLLWYMILLPNWGVLVIHISSFIGFQNLVTSTRYFFPFSILFLCFSVFFISGGKLKSSIALVLLSFYFFYAILHVIGDTEILLILEGLRHEVLFVLLALSLLVYSFYDREAFFLPEFNFILGAVLINFFVAAFFGVWQFFYINILEVIYNVPLNEIGNTKLAVGYRLLSTLGNPINFGAYMVLAFVVIQYFFDISKIGLIFYYLSFLLIFMLVLGSLSRIALLSLVSVVTLFIFFRASVFRIVSVCFFITLLVTFMFLNFDLTSASSRIETLFNLSTYTQNARVANWIFAINTLEPYQYIWGRGLGASSPDFSVVSETSALLIENAYISIFFQYGLIGIFLIGLIISRFFYIAIKYLKIDPAVGKFMLGFLCFFCIFSLGNDFLRNSPFVFYFWFFYVYLEIKYTQFSAKRPLRNFQNLHEMDR